MTNSNKKHSTKKTILISIVAAFVLMLTTIMAFAGLERGISANAFIPSGQAEATIFSSATLDDSFCDSTILLTLNRQASMLHTRNGASVSFKQHTKEDFPEVSIYSVRELTPGLILAQRQLTAAYSRLMRLNNSRELYNESWSVNLNSFRRILSLTLSEPGRENVLAAIKVLQNRPDVLAAEPNFITSIERCNKVSGKAASTQFNTNNTSPSTQWGLNAINAHGARGITRGNSSIKVGVIDTGIHASHPDLKGVVYTSLFRCFVPNSVASVYEDIHGHGTNSAGIIASNELGLTSIAPNVRLVSLRVVAGGGGGESDDTTAQAVVEAVSFATMPDENNPDLYIPVLSVNIGHLSYSVAMREAIEQFPGVFVAGAGNHNRDNDAIPHIPSTGPNFPSSFRYPVGHPLAGQRLSNIIAVGASDEKDVRSSWAGGFAGSHIGRTTVDIFAPGDNIRTTAPPNVRCRHCHVFHY